MPPTGTPMVPSHGFPATQHPGNSQDMEKIFDQQVQCLHEACTKNIIEFKGKFEPAFRIVKSQRQSNELEKLKSEKASLENRIQESEIQRSRLQEQNTKLRDIIIKTGNHDSESMDTVIIKSLCELRDLIQRIVQKHYVMIPGRLEHKSPHFKDQKTFFKGERFQPHVPESIRRYHVRAMMFEILSCEILTRPCFGLNEEIENGLGEFETALYASYQGDSKGATHPTEQHDKSVLQMCEDAYKLTLLVRGCKASYRFEKFEAGKIVDKQLESEIVCQAFEGHEGENVRGSRIAFTLFGALVKTFDLDLEKRCVLEKAHVICQV
ncbi:hypothetical protein MMC31_003981 [Peltigera leucophlebia]|nr:hypothetical protein [Peltigera leucophlebia]